MQCKSYSYFCSKNINVFEKYPSYTVNEFVINKLVKLTMLWKTGPLIAKCITLDLYSDLSVQILKVFIVYKIWLNKAM